MYNLKLGSGLLWAKRSEAANGPHGGVKFGSQKVILATQNEPKFGVLPIVYLHVVLEIKFAIRYVTHHEFNEDSHALGPQRSPCYSAW